MKRFGGHKMSEFIDSEDLRGVADHLESAIATMMNLVDPPFQRLQCAMRLLNTPTMLRWFEEIVDEGGDVGEAARIIRRHTQYDCPLTPSPEEARKLTRLLRELWQSAIERRREREIEAVLNA